MNSTDVYTFGELLTTLRKQHRISQNELAAKLDVHRNTIGNWERGTYLPESRTLVLEMAKHLHLNENETRQLLEASLTSASPYWLMPYQRNPFFTGRDEVLEQLHNVLVHERRAVLSQSYALSGLGGIGKTQTAIEYAYRYVNDYTAIFWISAETNGSIIASFTAIADLLNLPEKQDKESNRVLAAVTRWLTSHNDWLMIFDNVEDLELLKSVVPPARCGSLLFTTHRQALGFTTQILDLEKMTIEEGIRFLLHRARLLDPTATLDSLASNAVALAQEIVVAMDGLPLALDQAGAYIEATRCSLADYLRLFQSSQTHLLDERDGYADHPLSVVKTFALAFERLEKSNPAAAELLTVCAFLAPEAIPETFFRNGAVQLGPTFEELSADPLLFNTAIKALLTYSLVQRDPTPQTLTVHRLVQVVLKERLSEAMQSVWVRRMLQAMNQVFPGESLQAGYMQACERLLPHALLCITLSEQQNEKETLSYISLMSHVARYLSNRGRYAEAEPIYEQSLHFGENVLGSEHPLVAEALHGLAVLYREKGKYDEGEPLFRRALVIREQILGAEHALVAETLNELGVLYRRQGKYELAESLYKRALHIRERQLGAEHPHTAMSLNNLATLYRHQGDYVQAEPLYQRVLSIRQHQLGDKHPETVTTLADLAILYHNQGNYEQAEALYQQALHILSESLGPQHFETITVIHNLARLREDQGNSQEAISLYKQALVAREQVLGYNHPQTQQTRKCYVALLRNLGLDDEAAIVEQPQEE